MVYYRHILGFSKKDVHRIDIAFNNDNAFAVTSMITISKVDKNINKINDLSKKLLYYYYYYL